jgi:hypothetical protein
MVLGDVITKVFSARMPDDSCMFVADLIDNPKVAHFHCAGALSLYGIVGNADCCGVITVDWGGWLGMAHFLQDKAYDFDFLNVEK